MPEPLAVYVHIPFCPSKCGYCDFNSYAMTGDIMARTTAATIAEIERSPWRGRPAKTIFFGGGTPTYIPPEQLLAILNAVVLAHPPVENCEITSEANPGTVDATRFAAMRKGGFNRVSLGAQSFLDTDLIQLERVHKASEIERAVAAAREAGFDNLNLDLMFALPGQSVFAWRRNIERALALKPEHLSLYCLTIEQNTAFYKKQLRGQLDLPDDETQVAMYDECLARVAEAGYEQYEISNFALADRRCAHNLCYWYGEEYAGYGPGAVGMVDMTRYTNLKHPDRYCVAAASGEPLAFESESLDEATQRMERIMLGLRLNDGFDPLPLSISAKALTKVRDRRWVNESSGKIKLTSAGRHFCSEVALELS